MSSDTQIRTFKCDICFKLLNTHRELLQHNRIKHELQAHYKKVERLLSCVFCGVKLVSLNVLQNHMMTCKEYQGQNYNCHKCGQCCKGKKNIIRHIVKDNKQIGFGLINRQIRLDRSSPFKKTRTAFRGVLQAFELYPDTTFIDLNEFVLHYKDDMKNLMLRVLKILKSFKVQLCIQCSFARHVGPLVTYTVSYFCTNQKIFNSATNFDNYINDVIAHWDNAIHTFETNGSGWKLIDIDRLDLLVSLYLPQTAGSGCIDDLYHAHPELIKKQALISINDREQDDRCFLYCVLSFIAWKINDQAKNSKQIRLDRKSSLMKYLKYLNLKRMTFPVGLREIKFFEKDNNHLKIKINLYTYERIDEFTASVLPLYISKQPNAFHTINILRFKSHYYFIKNFNRLCGSTFSSYSKFCPNCISGFSTNKSLKSHLNICEKFKPTKVIMPKEKFYEFNQYQKTYRHEYMIICDFEAILKRTNIQLSNKTKQIQSHEPSCFSLVVVNDKSQIEYSKVYCGEDCIQIFFKELRVQVMKISGLLSEYKEMIPLTEEQKKIVSETTHCHLCKKPFASDEEKVLDHDHRTGLWRYALHNECNLKFRIPMKIPVIFHNLTSYDEHFIIKNLKSDDIMRKISVIPQSYEKYKSIMIDNVKFLDSCQFLSGSLDQLTKNLLNSNYDFPIVRQVFQKYIDDPEFKNLLFRKSIYCFDYMDSFEKFNNKQLPDYKEFFSTLTQKNVSIEEYEMAQLIWNKFGFKSMKEYTEFYCLLDSCLLGDIFAKFRNTIYSIYELDCLHYFSIPGLSWDAAMKYTKVRLELIQDPTIYKFIELSIRGGVCGCFKRLANANNEHCDNFEHQEPTNFIVNLDINNLYGFCLNKKMPVQNFKFLDLEQYEKIDWKKLKTNGKKGYIIQCDLEYEDSLHDLHEQFPLGPEVGKISTEQLSPHQHRIIDKLKQSGYKRTITEKLLLTLRDKKEYILHCKNLKLYLKLGMKLRKIYRVLEFEQNDFLKPYIELNTELRKKAETEFEKDLWKLLNNSIYGKSIEDKRKHMNVKFALNPKQCLKYVKSPLFENFKIINESLSLMKMKKKLVVLDKPIYIGTSVLELAKNYMYKIYYNMFKKYYNERLNLLYSDTDSFVFQIYTNDVEYDLKNVFKNIMDFSNYPKDHYCFDESKKKAIGYVKVENAEKHIQQFVGLKSKLYSILLNDKSEKRTAKGLNKSVLKNNVTHNHYVNVIENMTSYVSKMRRIQSQDHELKTIELQKHIFTAMDDKRFILDDGVSTLPFGHYKLNNSTE